MTLTPSSLLQRWTHLICLTLSRPLVCFQKVLRSPIIPPVRQASTLGVLLGNEYSAFHTPSLLAQRSPDSCRRIFGFQSSRTVPLSIRTCVTIYYLNELTAGGVQDVVALDDPGTSSWPARHSSPVFCRSPTAYHREHRWRGKSPLTNAWLVCSPRIWLPLGYPSMEI